MLTIRTAESRLQWARAGSESRYGVEFGSGRVTVDNWLNKGKKYAVLAIYNKEGHKLEEFKFNDQAETQWFDVVSKLHAAVEKNTWNQMLS